MGKYCYRHIKNVKDFPSYLSKSMDLKISDVILKLKNENFYKFIDPNTGELVDTLKDNRETIHENNDDLLSEDNIQKIKQNEEHDIEIELQQKCDKVLQKINEQLADSKNISMDELYAKRMSEMDEYARQRDLEMNSSHSS